MTSALVTGASRGIGRATAVELARRGVSLALVGRPSKELDESVELAREAGAPEAAAFACDLADTLSVEAAAYAVQTLWQSIRAAMIPPNRMWRGPAMYSGRGRQTAIASLPSQWLRSRRPSGLSGPQPQQ